MIRVMMLDDEKNVLRALRRVLATQPYEIEIFTRGADALQRGREATFDLVMSDYRMPGMNGVEFLAAFKELQPQAIRVILTGYTDLVAQQQAINEVGVYAIVDKPWNDDELKQILASALESRGVKASLSSE